MKTQHLLLLLAIACFPLHAQDKPVFEIDLGAEAKSKGLTVKAVLFGKSGELKTEGFGFPQRTTLAVEVHSVSETDDNLIILHIVQEAQKSANIGNNKTCKLVDETGAVWPLRAYGFDSEDGRPIFSPVTDGQIGLLLSPTQSERSLYLAFKLPGAPGKLRSVGIGDAAAMPSSK